MIIEEKKEKKKKISPLKQTSGEGYEFENSVGAYFISFLLSNQIFDRSLGQIIRIDFQTEADGYLLNDILLTCSLNDQIHKCLISVRSNQQFSKKGAPKDFVNAAWKNYLHEVSSKFDKKCDFLCLAITHLNPDLLTNLNILLKMASDQNSKDLANHLQQRGIVSEDVRKIFNSFECPKELALKYEVSSEDIGNLLKCVKVFEFDFELDHSEKFISGSRNCQDILLSRSPDDALALWKELESITWRLRKAGGSIDLETLIGGLRFKFRLKDYPVYQNDWVKILKYSKDYWQTIPSKIGEKVTLPRAEFLQKLHQSNSRITILIGESGSGKTTLVKLLADSKDRSKSKIIWWDGTWLNQEDITSFERKLGLSHFLSELFGTTPDMHNLAIIDGVDRIYSEIGFQRLSHLIQLLKLNKQESPWHVIITCQSEEWMRLHDSFVRHNILNEKENFVTTIYLDDLTNVEIDHILNEYPSLQKLKYNRSIRPLLKKPKILDLLARHSNETKDWTGESDFIRWFWETEVEKGNNPIQRSTILQKFSEYLANKWESDAAEMDIVASDLPIIEELIRDRLCKKFQSRISFSHDLYGDWARQRILITKSKNVTGYIKEKCDSPLWHRAIQLFGLHLIEQKEDSSQWSEMIRSLGDGSDSHLLAQDLILESVIYAADPLPLLEKVWPELSKDDGKLLKSLLIRFQYIATISNPLVQEKAREVGLDLTEAELIARLPYPPYWIPLIRFLSNHMSEVTKLDPKSIADLGYTWLQQTRDDYPLRKEVARLVLSIAEDVRKKQKNKDYHGYNEELIKSAYSAAIACVREDPERVIKIVLDICERSIPGEQYYASHKKVIHSKIDGDLEYPAPWPNGPNERIDSDFVKICLKESALLPLIRFKPELAREVCLAIMIEAPRPRSSYDDSSFWEEKLGLNTQANLYPAFYDKGPFLHFLEINSKESLELIIQIVNFATERWGEIHKKKHGITPDVRIIMSETSKYWIGDDTVYSWYRGSFGPDLLISSLMALEKFFYDKIDKNEPIEEFIDIISNESKSVAFGGLLISIGKYKPSLFLGSLKHLFSVPEFFDWELGLDINPRISISPGWIFQLQDRQKIVKNWYSLPHRKMSYKDITISAFIKSPEIRTFFDPIKLRWQEEIVQLNENDQKKHFLQILISWFDISNYTFIKDEEKGECVTYNPPSQIVNDYKENEEPIIQEANKRLQLQNFIFTCDELLKNREKSKDFNPNAVWDNLFVISTNQRYNIRLDYISKDDAICGGCAVLLVAYPEYLKKNPDKEKWCKEQIFNALNKPRQFQGALDSEENIVDLRWDSFCAWALPHIWAEDLESPKIREFVVRLAVDYHYKTVEILFSSCGEIREKLGDHFKELEHFILLWSAAKNRLKFNELEGTSFDVDHWLKKNASKFIKRKLSAKSPKLEDVENKDNKIKLRFSNYGRRTRLHLLGFDLKTIEAAFSWRKSLEKTLNITERTEWIEFLKDLLGFSSKQFGELNSDETEYDGSPNDWDQWLFSHIAFNIAELQSYESAQELWLPILSLGTECHEWVENFLFYWGMNLYYFKEKPENFIREWKSMIDFALSSPKWSFGETKNISDLDDMWCKLLELEDISSEKWDTEQKKFVNNMFNSYQKSAPIILKRRKIVEKYIAFLTKPAAEDLRLDSLEWLYTASIQVGSNYWNNRTMNERLASLLNLCWKYQSSKFSEKPESFEAFKKLLKNLADRQVPLAYAILDNASKTKFSS